VDARLLQHESVGVGDSPLVLLPGGLTGWQSWAPLVPALSADRRVVRVQPIPNAEGIAGRVGDPSYTADVERESLRLTLAQANVREMHLVGWSNGGRIALDFALAHPARVRTLTLIEPAAWWLVGDHSESARSFGAFIRGCAGRALSDRDVVEFLVTAGLGDADTDFTALPLWPVWWACRNCLSWYSEAWERSAASGLHGFERLTIPVLLIRGNNTAPWLSQVVDLIARRLANARVVELDGGHASILQRPDEFVAVLRDHVTAGEAPV
jgi:pimeloyl-ACP methyl ester carboxylesterase